MTRTDLLALAEPTYSVNEYGCTIEHRIFAPTALDEQGRCCGRKPLAYKTGGLHFFCCRCHREYDAAGKQRPNWSYNPLPDGNFSRDRPLTMKEAALLRAYAETVGG